MANVDRKQTWKHWILMVLAWGGLLWGAPSAAVSDPVKTMEKITARVMGELRRNHDAIQKNPDKIYELVNHLILPHVDFVEMSKWVAGRNAWGRASPAVRQAFVREFKALVVRTYATALNNYTNETIVFLPQRSKNFEGKTRVQIASQVTRNGGSGIRLDYRLIRHGNGWQVYDLIIEGVSLLKGYQAQFSEQIRRKGLESVVETIREHNQKGKKSA